MLNNLWQNIMFWPRMKNHEELCWWFSSIWYNLSYHISCWCWVFLWRKERQDSTPMQEWLKSEPNYYQEQISFNFNNSQNWISVMLITLSVSVTVMNGRLHSITLGHFKYLPTPFGLTEVLAVFQALVIEIKKFSQWLCFCVPWQPSHLLPGPKATQ